MGNNSIEVDKKTMAMMLRRLSRFFGRGESVFFGFGIRFILDGNPSLSIFQSHI